MQTTKTRSSSCISPALCAAFLTISAFGLNSAAQAQAPKPPTDAKRVVHSAKTGEIKYSDAEIGRLALPKKLRDFDLTLSWANPSTADWANGISFRKGESGMHLLLYTSDGEIGLFKVSSEGKLEDEARGVFNPVIKKDAGASNDLAIYVRGDRALVFVNKTYIDNYALGSAGDFGEVWLSTNGKESGSSKFKNLIVRTPANALPPAETVKQNPVAAKPIVVTAYSSGYEQHGRPAGMDNPDAGCSMFDDSRPVRSFQIRLNVRNNSTKPMKHYVGVALKANGKAAYTCYYRTGRNGGLAEVPPGDSRDMTIQAFVEPGENIASVIVFDEVVGESNRLTVK
jgi:hypothetical protein